MANASGHEAPRPFAIPARGWKEILLRVYAESGRDHIGLVAAGVAFYGLLALFPAITALMAVAGLVLDPAEVTDQMQSFAGLLPDGASSIILGQAVAVAGTEQAGLGLAALAGILFAIYSASRGVSSLIEGLNVAYDQQEERGFVRLTLLRLALTLVLLLGVVAGLVVIVVLPAILGFIDLGPATEWLIRGARWAVLIALTLVGIGVLYRFGPCRSGAKWRWLTPGALAASVGWVAATAAFSFYAENFGSYNESFGTLGGVIVLLMWLWMSAYVLLMGAEINAETELQTRIDTTVGPDKPMGLRGAVKADTLPPGVATAKEDEERRATP